MKYYKDGSFLQISRSLFTNGYFVELSSGAKELYLWLKELEHRYSNENGWFCRTDQQINEESNISISSIKRYRKELLESGLIVYRQSRWESETGMKSKERISCYKVF